MQLRTDELGWTWVSIETLLKHLTYSGDFGDLSGYLYDSVEFWGTMIESKALDRNFEEIVESLQTFGWGAPLNMEFYDEGEDEGPEFHIHDGHHRLVAAILLCMDEVPYWNWSMGGTAPRKNGCPMVTARYGHDDGLLVEVLPHD